MYSFNDTAAVWVRKADLPYQMSAITSRESAGKSASMRLVASQYEERECSDNYAFNYEYYLIKDKPCRHALLTCSRRCRGLHFSVFASLRRQCGALLLAHVQVVRLNRFAKGFHIGRAIG
jgi:hypothetical protein